MDHSVGSLNVTLADASSSDIRSHRRAYITPDALKSLRLHAGEWVELRDSAAGSVVVQLWPKVDQEDDKIALSETHKSNLDSDTVNVYRFDATCKYPRLRSVTVNSREGVDRSQREAQWMNAAAVEELASVKYVASGFTFIAGTKRWVIESVEKDSDDTRVSGLTNKLQDMSLGSKQSTTAICEFDWKTHVIFSDTTETSAKPASTVLPSYINLYTPSITGSAAYNSIGGLDTQINQIRALLEEPMKHPEVHAKFGLPTPRGILLHGPPGTGKTALARAFASSRADCTCIVVNGPELSSAYHGETEERLRNVFDEARSRRPCIIVLDEIDALCPRRDGGDGGEVERRVVATMLTLLDGIDTKAGVFVIGATNRPNAIDPALRRPGRFDREIEIGVPDMEARKQILAILLDKMPHSVTPNQLAGLASRTHGYVGADLSLLMREASSTAILRWKGDPETRVDIEDIETVLRSMRPSTMREIFVETQDVKWSDIGGQDEVKQKLRECVEWPLTHQATFKRLGVEAPKGVLLYGPPGCSKTLTAKALASESGLNFLAVKGPELLNKFVGESERAVREVFRKARTAAPSIIFFDEIDALGSSRSDETAHSGVLTSLLNEMDGIEELAGVIVVAATNRPEVLDSALLRPGRLDRILYVGAPDTTTRKDIFRIRISKMAVEQGTDVDELARLTEGCSGAEIASICQDAALMAINENVDAPFVKTEHFRHAAKTVRRRITPVMIRHFEQWRDQSGVRSA